MDVDTHVIYYNDFGIAFQWKRCAVRDLKKIQLVFRNTGLLLKPYELIQFSNNIDDVIKSSCFRNTSIAKDDRKLLLLEAPNPQTSFAMSYSEIKDMRDLINGTLFQMGLDSLLKEQMIVRS